MWLRYARAVLIRGWGVRIRSPRALDDSQKSDYAAVGSALLVANGAFLWRRESTMGRTREP